MENVAEYYNKLIDLIRLEEAEELEQFRQAFLHLSPQEREKAGKALLHLTILETHFSAGGHRLITLGYANGKKLPVFSLDTGDVVSLSREGAEFGRLPIGTVYDKKSDSITVAFDWLKDEWMDDDGVFHLNRAGNRATYKRMIEAVNSLRDTEHTRLARLRDIALGTKKAEQTDPVTVESLSFFNSDLNQFQKEAVAQALQAADVALIHGPPGTGKTTVLVEIIKQAVSQGRFVFASAPSNTACDNLLECIARTGLKVLRLGHPARIMSHLRQHTLDFQATSHSFAALIDDKEKTIESLFRKLDRHRDRRTLTRDVKRDLREQISDLKREVRLLEHEVIDQILKSTEVMVGTPASAKDSVLRERDIDVLVLDEATQATEPISWIPAMRAQKVVLAGDHFQLPPTVRSKEAEARGLGKSLFEIFHARLPETFRTLLRIQYRMHEKIMNFSSREFYEGNLIADQSVRGHVLADLKGVNKCSFTEEPFLFLDTAGRGFEEKLEAGSESRYNPDEGRLVLLQVEKLLEAGVNPADIAVISPYSAQVRYLSLHTPDSGIEIDSVDGFQGREKEVVVLSLVRSNVEGEMGFLADTRRMNVAMTRAKRKLLVVGDSATLSTLSFYQSFIQYAEAIGAYRSSWEEMA